jgi:RNase adaptor protein for sRNA GlmZ degradation
LLAPLWKCPRPSYRLPVSSLPEPPRKAPPKPLPPRQTLKEYLEEQLANQGRLKNMSETYVWFHKKSGVSTVTISMLCRGGKLHRIAKAQAIVKATKGAVRLEDIFEEPPPKEKT